MSVETVFDIANNGILVFWLLLIVAPHWRVTEVLVQSVVVPVVIGLTYTWLITMVFWPTLRVTGRSQTRPAVVPEAVQMM